jgi:hypothetical protein
MMAAMTSLEWVVSNGGPILVIPKELASRWRGDQPPPGVAVPLGWTWGDGGVVCDYDRACDDLDDAVRPGDGFSAWSIPVDGGRALVLEGETATTAVPWADWIVLLRDAPIDSEAQARELLAAVPPGDWVPSSHELEVVDGCLFVFDAAYPGAPAADAIEADGGVLHVALAPGRYHVSYAAPAHPSGARVTLARLGR